MKMKFTDEQDLNKHPLVIQYREAVENSGLNGQDHYSSDEVLLLMKNIMQLDNNEITPLDVFRWCSEHSIKKRPHKIGDFVYEMFDGLQYTVRPECASRISFNDLDIEIQYVGSASNHAARARNPSYFWRWIRKSEEDLTLLALAVSK